MREILHMLAVLALGVLSAMMFVHMVREREWSGWAYALVVAACLMIVILLD